MADVARVAPPIEVSAPVREQSRFGLFSVATMPDQAEPRFALGVQWEPTSCELAGSVSGDCYDPDLTPPADPPTGLGLPPQATSGVGPLVDATPFAVYGSYDCGPFSRPVEEAEIRARQHLAAREESEVERTIAAGDRNNRSTFQGATLLDTGVSLVDAIGQIESALAFLHGGQAVIHVPRLVGAHLAHARLASRQGARLETLGGTYVTLSTGLDIADVGPDGDPPPAGEVWLYGTPTPVVRRSDVWITPDPEFRPHHATNELEVFAWRTYVVGWECATVAVRVDLDLDRGEPEP